MKKTSKWIIWFRARAYRCQIWSLFLGKSGFNVNAGVRLEGILKQVASRLHSLSRPFHHNDLLNSVTPLAPLDARSPGFFSPGYNHQHEWWHFSSIPDEIHRDGSARNHPRVTRESYHITIWSNGKFRKFCMCLTKWEAKTVPISSRCIFVSLFWHGFTSNDNYVALSVLFASHMNYNAETTSLVFYVWYLNERVILPGNNTVGLIFW